eukprot:scaffold13112_cov78-Skeletonema_dohrnii-CCMP3373.AAC.1
MRLIRAMRSCQIWVRIVEGLMNLRGDALDRTPARQTWPGHMLMEPPTRSPTMSPVPTSNEPTCLRTGDGNGHIGVTQSGAKYALNSNSNANAWAGSIETSVDGGVSYTPMVCKDSCTPVGDSTASIVVDGDGNGDRAVKCLNGDTCTL